MEEQDEAEMGMILDKQKRTYEYPSKSKYPSNFCIAQRLYFWSKRNEIQGEQCVVSVCFQHFFAPKKSLIFYIGKICCFMSTLTWVLISIGYLIVHGFFLF